MHISTQMNPPDGRHVDELIETMALRGAAHAFRNRVDAARYWPKATRRGNTLALEVTSERPLLDAMPEPITTLGWDAHGAVDERLFNHACAIATDHELNAFEVQIRSTGAGYIVERVRAMHKTGVERDRSAFYMGPYAISRRKVAVSETLEEHLLIAWTLPTAIGELALEACNLDTRWTFDPRVRWTVHIDARTSEKDPSIDIQRERVEKRGDTVQGSYAEALMSMRFRDASPATT